MTPKPKTGLIVHYRLNDKDCVEINRRRDDSKRHFADNTGDAPGWIAHVGNRVNPGEIVPLLIVRVWPGDRLNGQVVLDGNDSFWACSVGQGHMDGQWTWPVRESAEEGR